MLQALVYLDYGRLLLPYWPSVEDGPCGAFEFVLAPLSGDDSSKLLHGSLWFNLVSSLHSDSFFFLGRNNSPPAITLVSYERPCEPLYETPSELAAFRSKPTQFNSTA